MKHILIVGIGAGNPEHITVQAINALNRAELLFIPTKGADKAELADVRRDICARYVTQPDSRIVEFAVPARQSEKQVYMESVDAWHSAVAEVYERLIAEELPDGATGAFLVWGDPMLYDSTIRILERVRSRDRVAFETSVVPGITSVQALCAAHKIPLNLVGRPVTITTGRHLGASLPDDGGTAVVMLDGGQAFTKIDDPDAHIYWGAYIGTPQEVTVAGRLADVAVDIVKIRADARDRHGWIMDTYLLRKDEDFPQ